MDTGFKSPSSNGSPNNNWTNPTNAYADDGSIATAPSNRFGDKPHDFGTFNFGLVGGEEIVGIELEIDGGGDTTDQDMEFKLSWDGGTTYTAIKTALDFVRWSSGGSVGTLGGATDTWGRSWTASELSDTNFRLWGYNPHTSRDFSVDHLRVKVYYQEGGVNVNDTITISESVTIQNTQLGGISVFEAVTISESVVVAIINLVSVFDSVSISESVAITLIHTISKFDAITLTEQVTVTNALLPASVSDQLTISESITLDVYGGDKDVDVFDSVTISESVTVGITSLVSVSDTFTITEQVMMLVIANIAGIDTISVVEQVTVSNTDLGGINVQSLITLAEFLSVEFGSEISIFDEVTITDAPTLQNVQLGSVDVSDDLSIFDAPNVAQGFNVAVGHRFVRGVKIL